MNAGFDFEVKEAEPVALVLDREAEASESTNGVKTGRVALAPSLEVEEDEALPTLDFPSLSGAVSGSGPGSTKGTKAALDVDDVEVLDVDAEVDLVGTPLGFDLAFVVVAVVLHLSAGATLASEVGPGSTEGANAGLALDVDDATEVGIFVVALDKDAAVGFVRALLLSVVVVVVVVVSSRKGANAVLPVALEDAPALFVVGLVSACSWSTSAPSSSPCNTSPAPKAGSGSLKISNLGPPVLAVVLATPVPREPPALNVVPLIFFTSGTFSFTLDTRVPNSAHGVAVSGPGGSFSPSSSCVPGAGSWNI